MKVRCNMCFWVGEDEDLERYFDKEEQQYFDGCPECKTDHYLMDYFTLNQDNENGGNI